MRPGVDCEASGGADVGQEALDLAAQLLRLQGELIGRPGDAGGGVAASSAARATATMSAVISLVPVEA